MDIGMPDLNGIEATRQLKAKTPRSRVIALSTYSDRRYVLGMLEAGAAGYIAKASAYDELRQAVRAVASGRTYLSPRIAALVSKRGTASSGQPSKSLLAPREREVIQLVAEGHSSLEIARRLHLSAHTVETHRRNIMQKLGLHSVAELTRYAIREGITSLDG
jgi:two-component system NarL family response regulator